MNPIIMKSIMMKQQQKENKIKNNEEKVNPHEYYEDKQFLIQPRLPTFFGNYNLFKGKTISGSLELLFF